DWQQLMPLLKAQLKAQPERKRVTETSNFTTRIHPTARPAIAIARDSAFNFYYRDNLDQLVSLGAELITWSPMADAALPAGCQGLYLGGGFPEVFAAELSQNKRARQSIRQAIAAGVPTYAECGGLMYLCQSLTDFAGATWPMVGSLPTQAVMDDVLTLGYRRAIAQQSTPLLAAGAVVRGHEFHRSRLTTAPSQPIYALGSLNAPSLDRLEGWKIHNLHASYLHLHWGERLEMPRNFVTACARQKPLN
ncbi:MAG: cobyrinic acid a,c-diamide synthase, partial [Cyanobacteria bacterium P01_H01_bin.119]